MDDERDDPSGLARRTSSLTIDSPVKKVTVTAARRPLKKVGSDIVIPDSEEERRQKKIEAGESEVIDLIDSDEEFFNPPPPRHTSQSSKDARGPPNDLIPRRPGSKSTKDTHADTTHAEITIELHTDTDDTEDEETQPRPVHKTPKHPRALRTILSDSEPESETEPDDEGPSLEQAGIDGVLHYNPPPSRRPITRVPNPSQIPSDPSTPSRGKEVMADPPSLYVAGSSISKPPPTNQSKLPDYFASTRQKGSAGQDVTEETSTNIPGPSSLISTSQRPKGITARTPRAKSSTKRKTKKQLEQEKHEQLSSYAQELFNDLNASVFTNGLPSTTAIVWNKRLAQTAGRAKWHIDRNNNHTTTIELSSKVIDSEERIRYTLAHEMCHLASWYISELPRENHGAVWKGWACKVTKYRPDIQISTRHKYEITYKYQWRCANESCQHEYGRHSNSIDPQKSVCGLCRTGQLIPLHTVRTRAKKEKMEAISNMLSAKPRDSPISAARARIEQNDNSATSLSSPPTPSRPSTKSSCEVIYITSGSESDSDPEMDKADGIGQLLQTPSDDEDVNLIETQNVFRTRSAENEGRSATEMDIDAGSAMDTDTNADTQMKSLETQMSFIDLTKD